MSELVGLDTSVAIPLLVRGHRAHRNVVSWWSKRPIALSGDALAETYAVLTRLPGDLRLAPADARRLLNDRFADPLTLSADTQIELPTIFSRLGVAGGAVYDALVALAAVEHGVPVATRDGRALGTYEAVGANVIVVTEDSTPVPCD